MSAMSIQDLRNKLEQSEKQLNKLIEKRSNLLEQISDVDEEIASLAGETSKTVKSSKKTTKKKKTKTSSKKKTSKKTTKKKAKKKTAKRVKNVKPLGDYIFDALNSAGKPMRAKDIHSTVKKAGYKSKSKEFYNNVVATLAADKRFKRVDRGVYGLTK